MTKSHSCASSLWVGPLHPQPARFQGWTRRTPAGRSTRLDTAYAALVDGLNAELAEWITAWAPTMPQQESAVLAVLGVNSILGARFATSLFHESTARIPDDRHLGRWTALLATRIETLT